VPLAPLLPLALPEPDGVELEGAELLAGALGAGLLIVVVDEGAGDGAGVLMVVVDVALGAGVGEVGVAGAWTVVFTIGVFDAACGCWLL
jgi:hypothetical protein